MNNIRNLYLSVIFATSLMACRSSGNVVTRSMTQSIETRIDTVYITLPKQTASEHTADSVSHLSIAFAESTARINADGTLSHTLNTTDAPVQVPVTSTIIRTDSITVLTPAKSENSISPIKSIKWAKILLLIIIIAVSCLTMRIYRR